jgi:HK97 family phage major capsid protein
MGTVLVKAPTLAKLFGDLSKKVQAGKITVGESRKHLEDAVDDGLHEQPQGAQRSTDSRGRQRVSFHDPDDADRSQQKAAVSPVKRKREILSKALDVNPDQLEEVPEFIGCKELSPAKVRAFQKLNDGLLFASAMIRNDDGSSFDPRTSKYYPALQKLAQQVVGGVDSKILTTTGSGTGAEWVPTVLSGQMIDLYRTKLQLAGLVEHFTIPRGVGTWELPLEGADVDPYLANGAADDDPADSTSAIKARTPGTSKVSFTGVGMKVRLLVNTEATEDAVIDMVEYLRRKGIQAMLNGTEGALINGDTTASHMDSDITASDHYLKAWDGLRDMTNSEAKVLLPSADGGKLKGIHFVNLRTKFGKFADDPSRLVNVVSHIGAAHLTADDDFTTIEKMGPNASLVTGQVGVVLGAPVIVSSKVRNNLNNSGVYDGSTTDKTIAITFHRDCFGLADKRMITVEAEKDIHTDKWIVVVTKRDDFARIQAEGSLERNVGLLLGIDTDVKF